MYSGIPRLRPEHNRSKYPDNPYPVPRDLGDDAFRFINVVLERNLQPTNENSFDTSRLDHDYSVQLYYKLLLGSILRLLSTKLFEDVLQQMQ
ncbi:hypothetical protein LWI28_001852 [Acer negundo]|uniref:Uncharacterized protein n=1 Tax=Acer negundo TaxID=4023 RepID=A0AAD5ICI2_ACENE|nr:hypothetical protein LWI28_001852 [Acer negundo]